MTAINSFTLTGNVTREVELRRTRNGIATVTFTLAVDNVYVDKEGRKHEACDFIPVTTYGKQAENDAKYLKKGMGVAVIGRIRSWYHKEEGRGGFAFEAARVQYLGKLGDKSAGKNPVPDSEHEAWMRDYERAEAAVTQQRGH